MPTEARDCRKPVSLNGGLLGLTLTKQQPDPSQTDNDLALAMPRVDWLSRRQGSFQLGYASQRGHRTTWPKRYACESVDRRS